LFFLKIKRYFFITAPGLSQTKSTIDNLSSTI
jgi:hypothetical protein